MDKAIGTIQYPILLNRVTAARGREPAFLQAVGRNERLAAGMDAAEAVANGQAQGCTLVSFDLYGLRWADVLVGPGEVTTSGPDVRHVWLRFTTDVGQDLTRDEEVDQVVMVVDEPKPDVALLKIAALSLAGLPDEFKATGRYAINAFLHVIRAVREVVYVPGQHDVPAGLPGAPHVRLPDPAPAPAASAPDHLYVGLTRGTVQDASAHLVIKRPASWWAA